MATTKAIIDVAVNTGAAAAELRNLQTQINSFNAALNKNNLIHAQVSRQFVDILTRGVNATQAFTAEQIRMETAAKRLDKTLTKGQGTLSQYFNARFRKDSAEAAAVLSLANARVQALETQFVKTTGAIGGFRDAIAIRPFQAFNSDVAVANEKLAIHRAMLRQATTSMINFGKNTQWAGRQLMVGFTVPLAIFGAAAGKTFQEIEQAAVRFKKVYGDAFTPPEEIEQNMKAIEGLALEFTKYGIAVKDTIGLAAEAAAAGAKNAELIAATTEATRLATLGQMEQSEALSATIALQNAFKLSSQQLATEVNFLNMVENQTVVTLQDLAEAIPRVAPVIVGLGGDVRDMAAMLAAMQEGGVSAAQGANALKSGLGSLINPTKKANDTLAQMGINLNAIVQTNRGDLMATVQAFGQALASLDQFSRQQALEEVFGKYQYARLGALFDNIVKDGTQASRVLQLAGMSAQDMAKSAERELSVISEATSTKYMAAMERFKMSIAPLGELFMKISTPIINFFARLFEMFDKLPDGVKNFAALATVLVGVVVPAGTMFLGLLMNLIGTLTKFGHIVGVAVKGFGQGGFAGAVQAVSQSLKYMSLEEINAAGAAQQLGLSTEFANDALVRQVAGANNAEIAVLRLKDAYMQVIQAQIQMANLSDQVFGPSMIAGAAAEETGAGRTPRVRRRNKGGPIFLNSGNQVPGMGNKDTVPAMLTPGEFVVNKKATEQNLSLLHAINDGGKVPGFNRGGKIPGMQYFGKNPFGPGGGKVSDLSKLLEQENLLLDKLGLIPTQSANAASRLRPYQLLSEVSDPAVLRKIADTMSGYFQSPVLQTLGSNVGLVRNPQGAVINNRLRLGRATVSDMMEVTKLVDYYNRTFNDVPAARAELTKLGLTPYHAAEMMTKHLPSRLDKLSSGIIIKDADIWKETEQAFSDAGLSTVFGALERERGAIRYSLPTEVLAALRKSGMARGSGGSIHGPSLSAAFGPENVSVIGTSDKPVYVIRGSAVGYSQDIGIRPGYTENYPQLGFSYQNIAREEIGWERLHAAAPQPFNKGGMIPGVQYFAGPNPGRVVLNPTGQRSLFKLLKDLRKQFWVKDTERAPVELSSYIPPTIAMGNQNEVNAALQLALRKGWITKEQANSEDFKKAFQSMLRTDLSHVRKARRRKTGDSEEKSFTARTVTARPGLENMGLNLLFGDKEKQAYINMKRVIDENPKFSKKYSNEIRRIVMNGGHTVSLKDYQFMDELFSLAYKSKNKDVQNFMQSKSLKTSYRWIPLLRALVKNKLQDKDFTRHQTFDQQVRGFLLEQGLINANSGGLIPGIQHLMAGSRVRGSGTSSEAMKAVTRRFLHERFMARDAKGQGITDFIFRRGEDGKLNLNSNELVALLTENPNVTDKQLAQIAKYHGSRIRDGVFGKFDSEVGYRAQDPHASTWRHIARILSERGHPVIQGKNSGGLIDGIQHLVGGGPAIGSTIRRTLSNVQKQILASEPEVTLESAAQKYADYGYSKLTPAERTILSQSRKPFAGPQLFRGAGGSSPLIDSKLRDALARGSYRDIIDLEGEMIPFPKGSWSTDERIAYDHMRYFASENQEWSNAIDMLTVRGSVPLYGSTYKEHIKGEQANVIRKIKDLKAQLKQAQDRMSPEAVAQEEARIEQLRLAVEQERKSARSKLGFTEDQDLTLTQRAMISDTVRESKAQRDYDIAKQSYKTNLEYPTELQRRIDEQIKGLYYKRNARKQAFAELERLRQQGSNVNVFFKATKSDRYVPPGQAKISYIQDLTEGDPNDPLTTKLYVIGLDMGYPEMVDISGKPFARHGGRTNEYEFIRQNKGGLIPVQHFQEGGDVEALQAFASGNVFQSATKNYVPGVGNTDTVPAALTPGEFVVNKSATAQNLPLLRAINDGAVPGYMTGGEVRAYQGNQYHGPGWRVYDAANQPIKDPNTGKAITFANIDDANAALKTYQDKVAERFKSLSGGKDISGIESSKLYPGKIEQDRNTPGDERFSKWVVYDDDGNEISRHQNYKEARNALAQFRQESRKQVLGSLKTPLTGKQKAAMLVSTLGISLLGATFAGIFSKQRQDNKEFIGQSNVLVDEVAPTDWTYLNNGNQVPGVGNKDTVPAMLTPGEFVVNKNATSQNLPLLHAINDGQAIGMNRGGKVPGAQYLAMGGMAKMLAAQMGVGLAGGMGGAAIGGAMGGDTGAMIGGFAGSIIPSLLLPRSLGGLLGAGGGAGGGAAASGAMALLLNPITGALAAAVAAIAATTYTFYKMSESNMAEFEAGRRLADAMTTTSSEIDKLGTSARVRSQNMDKYLKQEEDDFIEAKYNRKIAKAKTEAEKNRLKAEKEIAMKAAGGKTLVSENIDQFYKEQIAQSKKAQQVPSYLPITNAEKAAQPQTSELYSLRNRMLGVRFAKAGPQATDSGYGRSFIEGAGKEVFESVKAMRDMTNQLAKGDLSSAQYQGILDTGKAAYGKNLNINQISEKDLAAKLSQYILSGVMTQDQASSVAAAIGKEIKDSGFGERVANEVITVVGAEGAFAKYNPGVVAQRLTEQNQKRVDEYQKRIETMMPQFFAPETDRGRTLNNLNQVSMPLLSSMGPMGMLASAGQTMATQGAMDFSRSQARDEYLARRRQQGLGAPNMQDMAKWRESFFTAFFSGMADQLRRDMGGFIEASTANIQMLEENISVIQVRYNEMISKATTLQEKERLRYEQANQMADLEEKRLKAQEQIFAPFGGRQTYGQDVSQTLQAQRETFGYKVSFGADLVRANLGAAQAAPIGTNDILGSMKNVGGIITSAFAVGGANIAETLNNVLGNFGDWFNKTGFGDGNTFGEIYATQLAEGFNKKFEGSQLGINVDTLQQVYEDLNIVTGESMDKQLFFIRQMGMQNEEAATKFSGMIVSTLAAIEAASPAGGPKAPGEYALTEAEARQASGKMALLQAGQLPGGQQLNMETLTDISTASSTLGTENLLTFIDEMTKLGSIAPQTTERLAAAFAQAGDAINVTTTSGKSMFDMLLKNQKILSDDQFFENFVRGSQHFNQQSELVRQALGKMITGPESFAMFGKMIDEANPAKFNKDLGILEKNLRRVTKEGLTIPKENKKDWKYVLDTFKRIAQIKDPDIRAKLEGEIEPEVFTMMSLVNQLQSEQDAGKRQIIIEQIIEINQSVQTKVTGAEQKQKEKVSGGGGGAKPDPLGEQMRSLRDQIHNQERVGAEIEASGEKAFGTFARLRQKMGVAARQGFGESLINYFKSLDPTTALQVGKEVLKNQGKLNTILSLMSQNAMSAQREQTNAAKQRTKFLGKVINAAPLAGQSMMYMSQMYADEEAMAQLDAAVAGAKNNKQANKIAKDFARNYAIQKQQQQQQRALLSPSQLQFETGMNVVQYQGNQGLQQTLGFTQEEASLAMSNQNIQALVENLVRSGKKVSDLSKEERQSILDFVNSQKTMQGEFNKAIDEVKEELQNVNTILQDSIQYIEEYNIKPLQDQLQGIQDQNAEYSEQSRRLSHALSRLQEKIRIESEKIQEREKAVNETYNERITALDKVSRINERIANQQRMQLDLSSALSRGDVAGAAQAALAMQQDYAKSQQEDVKTALTEQRDAELKDLQKERDNLKNMTIEYNGELLTTEQIQSRIDGLSEKIYQNSLLEYDIQKKITAEKQRQEDLANQQAKVDRVINVSERAQTAANEQAGSRRGELLGIASAARLTNTAQGNDIATQIESRLGDLNIMDNEAISLELSNILGPFMTSMGQQLGQDLTGLGTIMPGLTGEELATVSASVPNVISEMNADLVDLQEQYKVNPFSKLTIGLEKLKSAIDGAFAAIPKEPGSGGGTPDKPKKPGTTTADQQFKIPAAVSQGREDAINTRVSTTSINGKTVRITTYYDADGQKIPNLTKYEVGVSAASPEGRNAMIYTEQQAGQQVAGAVDHPLNISNRGTPMRPTQIGMLGQGFKAGTMLDGMYEQLLSDPEYGTEFEKIGRYEIVKALVQGIQKGTVNPSNQSEVRAYIIDMFKASLGIASPAKEVIPIGNAVSEGIFQGILNTFKNLPGVQFLSNLTTTFAGWITNGMSSIMALGKSILGDNIGGIFGGLVSNIINLSPDQLLTNLFTKLRSIFGISAEGVASTLGSITSIGKSILDGFMSGITTNISTIANFGTTVIGKISSFFMEKGNPIQAIKDIGSGILKGIIPDFNSVDLSTAGAGVITLINKIKNLFSAEALNPLSTIGLTIINKIVEKLPLPLQAIFKNALGIGTAVVPPTSTETPSVSTADRSEGGTGRKKPINRYSAMKGGAPEEDQIDIESQFEDDLIKLSKAVSQFVGETGLPYILSSMLSGMVEVVNGFFQHVKEVLNQITITIPPIKLSFAASGTGQDAKGNSISWSVSGSGSTKEASTKISPLVTSVVAAQKKAFGGMINYKGSREQAPGMMFGGKMKKYAMGSFVPGIGSTDKVPALLTPGEFVVRKPVVEQIGPLLSAVNSNVFPAMNLGTTTPKPVNNNAGGTVQYNYNVEVNVAGTNASPDDIANAVMSKINSVNDRQIRSIKINGNG